MNFEEARAEYARLRQAYESRQLSPEEYGQRIQALQVRDAGGTYWAIDGASGNWLRHDGANWVPGQPPMAQAPQPGYGAPQQSQQQSGGYGDPGATQIGPAGGAGQAYTPPQQGGYAPQSPAQASGYSAPQQGMAAPVAATPQRSNRRLIAGCAAVLGVLLVACIGFFAFVLLSGGSIRSAFDRSSGITQAATAKGVTSASRPDNETTDFTTGSQMYITYTANNAKKGQNVDLKLFLNGTPVALNSTQKVFEKDATYRGYYSYTPTKAGRYRAELYFNGEASPSKTLDFTVK